MTNNKQHLKNEQFELWRKRILWQCKRGNLETELLLDHYIKQLEPIAPPQQQLIEQLLAESEQDLFHWLMGEDAATSRQDSPHLRTATVIKSPIKTQYLPLIADIKTSYQ